MLSPRHLVAVFIASCALVLAAPVAAAPVTRYVSTTGDDVSNTNDCSASGSPCLTIQNALSQSVAGDEVIVAAGTYNISNELTTSVAVYLHGDLGGPRPVVQGSGLPLWISQPGTTVRHLAFQVTGTSFGFTGGAIQADAGNVLLDDLDVSLDNAGSAVNTSAVEAAPQSPGPTIVTLSNSTISANTNIAQPAVWAASGQLVLRNTSISRRGSSPSSDPALGAQGGNPTATIDAQNVTIDTTTNPCITLYSNSGATTLIKDVTATQDAPGAGNAQQPCIVVDRTSTFQNVTVNAPESNIAGSPVGGWLTGTVPAVALGLTFPPSSADIVLKNMTVNTRGIGLVAGTISGLQIRGGRFTGRFAGFQIYGATGVISDAFITGTDTDSYGVVADNGSSIKLRNLTAVGTGTRQAIYAQDSGTDITVKNTIARATGAGEDLGTENSATIVVSYSNYVDKAQLGGTGGTITDTGGHQTSDPLFTNPSLFDYHVLAGSPVIDAGTTDPDLGATDIDGDPRIQDSAPDIGADERAKPPKPTDNGGGGGTQTTTTPTQTTTTQTETTAAPAPTPTPSPTPTQNVPGPVVTISAAAVKVTKTGVANIRIGCPATAAGACTGTLSLQTATPVSTAAAKKVVKLGSRSFKLGAGKQAFVGVKLNKQGLKLLKKLKRLRVKAIADVHDANGAARITQRLLSLKLR